MKPPVLLWAIAPLTAVVATLTTGASTALFLQQPNKLIDGQGNCISVSDGDIYSGAELKVQACDRRHPLWQIFRSIPYARKYNAEYSVIQVDGKCVQTEVSGVEGSTDLGLITTECTFNDNQLFKWIVNSRGRYQLQGRESGLCIGSDWEQNTLMKTCGANAPDQVWSLNPIGGAFCDDGVWNEFKKGGWSVGDLMRRVGLDDTQYYNTIANQGIPSLTMADINLLVNCDIDIQNYFFDLERNNHNMFAKLLTYPGTYNTQVILATENTIYMFLESKLSNQVWKSLEPLAENFIDQFALFLSTKYPQYRWMVNIGKEVIKKGINNTDNGTPPELSSWGSRVQAIFNESVDSIWNMHIQVLNSTDHQKYESYATLYQTKTIQEIFGSEEDIRSQITVMLSKQISKAPAMASYCCVTRHSLKLGGTDYQDPETGLYYRAVFPGRTHQQMFSKPLSKFVDIVDLVHSRNGWGLRQVQTFSNWGTCTLPI
ncbi:hypothetical protein H4R33_003184 [Dimargaris cristalligena]|uniref:Uncharacterized protein n=1 Tax=Dimargaris cristalligena TaxID=215637 RepID=A0A4Q0A0Y3_9FUNG|nr:hypothetical protein H4R33_003184 [Dimargaris cristalligena]RKP39101.1 hypothetical protein BJ085DRAFT_28942 [Dimargaris cristalligena]|eukprot:RKP39101.1 hypothetical protein BJ085DRAFT_28942 [Dimargaris cristalligena]